MPTPQPQPPRRFRVQEFAAGKWRTLKSFATRAEAESWAGPARHGMRIREAK